VSREAAVAARRERARDLVYRGDDLYTEGRHGEALEAYAEADALVRVPTTRIEVAKALEAVGSFIEAQAIAAELASEPAPKPEPKPFTEARVRARDLARELDEKIPRLKVKVVPATSYDVRIDGRRVTSEEASRGVPLDPGPHVVVVEAEGRAPESRRVFLRAKDRRDLAVALGPRQNPVSSSAIASFVISGIGLTAGTVTGITALAKGRDNDELAIATGAGFGVAAVGGAAGGVLILLDQPDPPMAPAAAARVGPTSVAFSW
jgi:hypothetical protein